MRMNNETVQRTWIREDTLTMLLVIPLVLCIIYMKNDKYTRVQYNAIQKQCHTCTVRTLPIATDLHQQAGDFTQWLDLKHKNSAKMARYGNSTKVHLGASVTHPGATRNCLVAGHTRLGTTRH